MELIKQQIQEYLAQVEDGAEVLEQVLQLLQKYLEEQEQPAGFAADDEIVTYDPETGRPITFRENVEQIEREIAEADREGTWITLEQARKRVSEW